MAKNTTDIKALQAKLKAAGARWEAGPTSLDNLSEDERRYRLGYTPGGGETGIKEREVTGTANFAAMRTIKASVARPAAMNWLDVGGRCFVSDIKDQGQCGSCVAFGTTATIDAAMRISTNIAVNDPNAGVLSDLSEAQLYYCGGAASGANCASGWNVGAALNYCTNPGLAPESCFPYSAGDQPCNPCSNWQSMVTQIGSSGYISDIESMKVWIANNGPLISCFAVYSDFYSYSSGVYELSQGATYEGGHCISVMGYDDNLQAWQCKNSWGTGWGMGGFFYIGYGQCGIDAGMWNIINFTTIYETNSSK